MISKNFSKPRTALGAVLFMAALAATKADQDKLTCHQYWVRPSSGAPAAPSSRRPAAHAPR